LKKFILELPLEKTKSPGTAQNGAGQNVATETARSKHRRSKRHKAKTAHSQNGANPKQHKV